jgi:parallel beta-helix repeat protein
LARNKRYDLIYCIMICAFSILLLTSPTRNEDCFAEVSMSFLGMTGAGSSVFQTFSSIQQAINEAEIGATIRVPAGVYYEHLIINKTISLVAETNSAAVIDGNNSGTVVEITADNVTISGFVLQNSGYGWVRHGIYVYKADYCTIEENHLFKDCHNVRLNYSRGSSVKGNVIDGMMTEPTMYGIRVENSVNCTVEGNHVSDCVGAVHLQNATGCVVKKNLLDGNSQGIRLYTPCMYNEILENNVCSNSYDGMITDMPDNATFVGNKIFHNNFINNTFPFIYKVYGTAWDDGYPSGGNYWNSYNGSDIHSGPYQNETGPDGIGDTQYSVDSYDADRYPLMEPYGSVRNLDTNLTYLTIQGAIDASETMNGHVIFVKNGVYNEHVLISKALTLFGEEENMTIIDGGNRGTVVTIAADDVNVSKFTIRKSGSNFPPYDNDCGILLDHRTGCTLSQIQTTDNRIGIYLFFSTNNSIDHCLAYRNRENGIWLWYSGRNALYENRMLENPYDFGVFGGNFSDFCNSIDATNLVEDKSIQYVVGAENVRFDDSTRAGVVYLIDCFNVTVSDLNLTKNGHGVFCYNVTHSEIQNVTTTANNYGIYLQDSSNDTVEDNADFGDWVGIALQDSSDIVVKRNIAMDAEKGLSLYKAYGNRIEENSFCNSLFGIRLFNSNLNTFFHNNMIDNDLQVDLINSIGNIWDNGLEGNFWSDHQSCDIDRNGIADEEYLIDAQNIDQRPLLGLYNSYEINFEAGPNEVTVVSNSTVHDLVFESNNHALILTVEGPNGTTGFCRVCVPHTLIEPELRVIVDNDLAKVTYANYNLFDNGIRRWVYFEYEHSLHEIVILYEFQGPSLWLLFMVLTIGLILCSKGNVKRQS